jgi:hypothetical protein
VLCFLAPPILAVDPPEVTIKPAQPRVTRLTKQEQKLVNKAIDRGVGYLRRIQRGNGVFGDGLALVRHWDAGFAALGGLTLLECGVTPTDPAIQKAARFVRLHSPRKTYEISLAILFLDRLNEAGDRPLIRSLALRLATGQRAHGGWGYFCPVLRKEQEQRLLKSLRQGKHISLGWRPANGGEGLHGYADNSNTQFAILGLWAGRRHDVSVDHILVRTEKWFRSSQQVEGWSYTYSLRPGREYGAMTCAGLLGLAVGRAVTRIEAKGELAPEPSNAEDEGIQRGLRALAAYLVDPTDGTTKAKGTRSRVWGKQGTLHFYFLWSVERVGVFCNLKTIGGKDWYRWGVKVLLPAQSANGSWFGWGTGSPISDTCFALLFLRRADLLPGLRQELPKRVRIVDPGPFGKSSLGKKGSKGKKGDALPDWKRLAASTLDDGALAVDLGEVSMGKAVEKPLRVRGPSAFRITGIRGGARLKAKTASRPAKVHDPTLTLHLDQSGPFKRTLYLQTDLPGRSEVAIRIRATGAPADDR